MLPFIWVFARTYAPFIMLPVAAVVGVIGYNLENILSDKYTPSKPSIEEQREERRLKEISTNSNETPLTQTLSEKKFVPKSIFEKNMSPQFNPVTKEKQ